MSAIEPLINLTGINLSLLKKEERTILEARLFVCICDELKNIFTMPEKNYFRLLKLTREQEENMLEAGFVHSIIRDIISSGEYDIQGIAQYTDTFQEVIEEFITGQNTNPSAMFLRRLINLHASVRRELYTIIIQKIIDQYVKSSTDKDNNKKENICSEK